MQSAISKKVMPSLLFFLSFLIVSIQSMAKGGSLTGKITDAAGMPLSGATVTIRGTSQSEWTTEQGDFSFSNAPQNETLVVTYVGYRQQEVRYQNRQAGTITLEEAIAHTEDYAESLLSNSYVQVLIFHSAAFFVCNDADKESSFLIYFW